MACKSPWGIRWEAYTSEIQMELFIISTTGMHPKVVIWLRGEQDSLRSPVLIAMGIPQATTSLAGDVPEKMECEVELVRMSSPRLGAGWRTTIEQQKDGQTVTMGGGAVNKSPLMVHNDWDHADSTQGERRKNDRCIGWVGSLVLQKQVCDHFCLFE